MTIARRKQLRVDITPFYHCTVRCVRRAFLCGRDQLTQQNFDHRRKWIEEHLLLLSQVFCIEIAGYAVMSNHYHVLLKVNQPLAQSLSDDQVIQRWRLLFKGPNVLKRHLDGHTLDQHELEELKETVAKWRDHLTNISRFMAHINESIARKANKEDDCKGRFWESRFKMQAVLDLKALLRTMSYIDLNEVRAKKASTPESSSYCSVRRRLQHKLDGLMPFAEETQSKLDPKQMTFDTIPVSFQDYLQLLDWTGREIKRDKRGAIDPSAPPILTRIGYTDKQWLKSHSPARPWMQKAIGHAEAVTQYCAALGQKWIWQQVF